MTAYTYILYPHVRPEIIWAESIEEAIKLVKDKMKPNQHGLICPFGTTDKIELTPSKYDHDQYQPILPI